jgi:Ca-activated chloride channel homolog
MSWSDPGWLAFAGLALAGAAATPLLARWRTLQQARLASRPLWLRWFGAAPATGGARLALWLLAAAAAATAAAGPRWGRAGTVAGEGVSAAIALDESASMRCADVHPDRIGLATEVLRQAIERTPRATWALAVGAGDARARVPLTDDSGTVASALADRSLGAGLAPGSNLALLLATAASLLDGGGPARAIILVSDGEQLEGDAAAMAQQLRRRGIAIVTLLAGRESGAPVPRRDAQGTITYVRDAAGELVRSRAHPAFLRELCANPGDAVDAGSPGAAAALADAVGRAVRVTARTATAVRSAPAALAAALLATASFLLWPWRRTAGALLLALPATLAAAPPTPAAWQRALPGSAAVLARRGGAALERGSWNEASRAYAAALALRPRDASLRLGWATAAALAGEPGGEAALERLTGDPGAAAAAWFNLGTVRLLRGDAAGAVAPLQRAAAADPSRSDAWRNLEIALARSRPDSGRGPAPATNGAGDRARLVEAAARAALVPVAYDGAAPAGAASGGTW